MDEFSILKRHTIIGYDIVKTVDEIPGLKEGVLSHHERYDGKGYPDGLKGEEIPLAARIVAVADTFHALISDRPYRKGLPIEKAIEILRIGAGIQWDAELVRKFIVIAPSLITTI